MGRSLTNEHFCANVLSVHAFDAIKFTLDGERKLVAISVYGWGNLTKWKRRRGIVSVLKVHI